MGKRGPGKKDDRQRWLHGSGGKPSDTGNGDYKKILVDAGILEPEEAEPAERPKMPRPPRYFNDHSKRIWKELGADLLALEALTSSDMFSFEMLCRNYGQWREAEELVAEEGLTVAGSRGSPVRHPATLVSREAFAQFYKLLQHFPITPLTAERLGLGTVD